MTTQRKIGNVFVLILGIGILVAALLADVIGIGYGDHTSFGIQQTMGTVIGAVITIVGLFLMFKSR
jgi:Mn2+/Fe2+ NRAMP family transporter